jgi:hypothetical protein
MSYENCYNFYKINNNNGIFDSSVDATYIINLENNGRIDDINNELKKIQPTKTVYIVFNKGYKKCKKADYINTPPLDLVDAFINVFKHAEQQNYNNILILEDDFMFNDKIMNKDIITVNKNINNIKKKEFIYFFGCLPLIQYPISLNNYSLLTSIGTHSIVYSKEFRKKTLKIDQQKIKDWDYYIGNCHVQKYNFYKPIYFQLFPNTENSKYWDNSILFIIIKKLIQIFKLDKKTDPGYLYFYTFSKLIPLLFIIIIFNILSKRI